MEARREHWVTKTTDGRCLGLIGGLGVGATVHYYQELVKAHDARRSSLQLVMTHAEVDRVVECVQAGAADRLAQYLAGFVGRLQAAGAEVAVIPAVTPHMCISELTTISPLPLVNVLEAIREEVLARRYRRVALFGTRFVIKTGLFGRLSQVEVVNPKADEIDYIHNAYFQVALSGTGTKEHHTGLTRLAHTLVERDGVEAIVFAGTDLSLLFNEANTDFPHVDCSRVHIRAIMRALFDKRLIPTA
jgi:aspartate racemase